MNGGRSTSIAMILGCAAGCSFTPAYHAPPISAPDPTAYKEMGVWKVAEPMDSQPRGEWWTVFKDTRLDELELKVGAANQTIRAAVARLQQARAETRIQRAGLFPALSVGSSATRSRVSLNSPRVPARGRAGGWKFRSGGGSFL